MHPTFSPDELAATRALVESLGDRETVRALGVFHVAFDRRALPEVIGVTSAEADYLVGQLENERWVVSEGYICRLHPCVSPALGSALGRSRWVELSERWLSALLSAVARRRAGGLALARDEVAARLAHIEAGVNAAALLLGEALGDVAWLRSGSLQILPDLAEQAALLDARLQERLGDWGPEAFELELRLLDARAAADQLTGAEALCRTAEWVAARTPGQSSLVRALARLRLGVALHKSPMTSEEMQTLLGDEPAALPRFHQAVARLDQAVAELSRLPGDEARRHEVVARRARADAMRPAQRHREADLEYREAARLAAEQGLFPAVASALLAAGKNLNSLIEPEAALAVLEAARRGFEELGDAPALADVWQQIAFARVDQGVLPDGEAAWRTALSLAGDGEHAADLGLAFAEHCALHGHAGAAEVAYREATRLTTDGARAAELVKLRGELHAQHGQAAQAVEALREARARFVALGDELEADACSELLEELSGA
ncbi:MAG: hypothetical protein HOO96_11840 [Polyangiaceae bacterium]|nr:hypothetical protein [Polyangiaceae bacterium]